MKRSARNVNPSLSSDPRDKLLACINWPIGKVQTGADYKAAPMYFDACWHWYQKLNGAQADLASDISDAWAMSPDRKRQRLGRRICHRRRGTRCDPERDIWAARSVDGKALRRRRHDRSRATCRSAVCSKRLLG
jgi:hypothetical protein